MLLKAVVRRVAVALLQEPYVSGAKEMRNRQGVCLYQNANRWPPDPRTVKAAIAVFNEHLKIKPYPKLTTNNFVVLGIQAETWEVTLDSFYFEPETLIQPYLEHLKLISTSVKTRWVAGGDANAKSYWC